MLTSKGAAVGGNSESVRLANTGQDSSAGTNHQTLLMDGGALSQTEATLPALVAYLLLSNRLSRRV